MKIQRLFHAGSAALIASAVILLSGWGATATVRPASLVQFGGHHNQGYGFIIDHPSAFLAYHDDSTWHRPSTTHASTPSIHYVNGTILGVNFAPSYNPEFINRPIVLKSISIRVNRNGSTITNTDANIPLRIGSTITLWFNSKIPPGIVTPRVGDMVSINYTVSNSKSGSKIPVLHGNWDSFMNRLSWINLTEPVSGKNIMPGQALHIAGFVPDPAIWGKWVAVNILAGFLRPSDTWDSAQIRIGTDGIVDATIQLPESTFPKLHGNALTLMMQPEVRQGQLSQILLFPGNK